MGPHGPWRLVLVALALAMVATPWSPVGTRPGNHRDLLLPEERIPAIDAARQDRAPSEMHFVENDGQVANPAIRLAAMSQASYGFAVATEPGAVAPRAVTVVPGVLHDGPEVRRGRPELRPGGPEACHGRPRPCHDREGCGNEGPQVWDDRPQVGRGCPRLCRKCEMFCHENGEGTAAVEYLRGGHFELRWRGFLGFRGGGAPRRLRSPVKGMARSPPPQWLRVSPPVLSDGGGRGAISP